MYLSLYYGHFPHNNHFYFFHSIAREAKTPEFSQADRRPTRLRATDENPNKNTFVIGSLGSKRSDFVMQRSEKLSDYASPRDDLTATLP